MNGASIKVKKLSDDWLVCLDAATGHWEFGAIDWDEFRRVLAGDGPCNRERLAARRRAHDDGAWVREAALAYAAKHRSAARREAA